MKSSTLSLRVVSASALLSALSVPAFALTLTFNNNNGDFLTGANWVSAGTVPTSADVAIIRAANATTSRTANLAGTASVGTLIVGDDVASATVGGNLILNAGAVLTVSSGTQIARNTGNSASNIGAITMNGGSLTTAGLYVGANVTGTNAGAGAFTINDGSLTITGANNLKIGGETSSRTGAFTINGDTATISGGTGLLALSQWGTVNFNFDTTGVSKISFGTINLASAGTAGAVGVNGAAYTGGSGVFTLFDANTALTGYSLSAFNVTGFNSSLYTTLVSFDSGTQNVLLTVTAVPEPSTYAAGAGMLALAFAAGRSRRRQA